MKSPRVKPDIRPGLVSAWGAAIADLDLELDLGGPIPKGMGFRAWCESLTVPRRDARTGKMRPALLVDGQPFTLADRPAMAWIYDQVPSTVEEARQKWLVLRKCTQVGFTVMEMLIAIYLALKFEPLKLGFYLPSKDLAEGKSQTRFMPIIETIAEAAERMGQGKLTMRPMGKSSFRFLWTSGKTTTESYPMDVVLFDEVQEMLIKDIEKTLERMSGSQMKFTVMGSTANWPDADIDYFYKRGSQHRFHTRCPTCGRAEPLDEYFPNCIKFDPDCQDRLTGLPGDYRYVCRDGHWIDDPQSGEWIADAPDPTDRRITSIHFHQMLSPTVSPREIYEAYLGADDMKNFENRKLGRPYQDRNQIPVTLEHLNACAAEGMRRGLVWRKFARSSFMGIDQMGAHNVVVIKSRLEDGCQAVIHVEEVYGPDPFARCDELMEAYGVQVCVLEQLPNFNDAQRFAARHEGRVFLCDGYGTFDEGMMRWGDGPRLDASERRTDELERTRYTVRIDQYKAMSRSLGRLVNTECLFPDPQGLIQEVRIKEAVETKALLKDVVFLHFQKTALVTERINEGERKLKRRVVKVGIDPHFSYANMLCDIAFSRAYGTATFILPTGDRSEPTRAEAIQDALPGLPAAIVEKMVVNLPASECCGRCEFYPVGPNGVPVSAYCSQYRADVDAKDPACPAWIPA